MIISENKPIYKNILKYISLYIRAMSTVQYRKWSPTANDPETANDPRPQVIPKVDRKWSRKKSRNDLDWS